MKPSARKLLILSLGLFLAIAIMNIQPSYAADASKNMPTFDLASFNNETIPDKELQVTVKGRDLKDLYAYEINLKYDNSLLQLKSAVSAVKGFSITPIVEGDSIKFASTKTGDQPGENGNFPLCTLTFTIKGTGAAIIELLNVEYVNSKLELSRNETAVRRSFTVGLKDFSDIVGHWAELNIRKAAQLGFVEGYPDGTFRPQRHVTRAEFVTMLARALNWTNSESGQVDFADYEEIPAWAAPYVAAASERGVIEGYEDRTFRSSRPITRDEATKMMVIALGLDIQKDEASSFEDANRIPAWAQPYVSTALAEGLVQGRGNNLFAPRENITRAETVTLILAALEKMQVVN